MERVLVREEIKKFKDIRKRNYYRIVKDMTKIQKEYLEMEE